MADNRHRSETPDTGQGDAKRVGTHCYTSPIECARSLAHAAGVWCNGSTTDSELVSPGSNPGTPAKRFQWLMIEIKSCLDTHSIVGICMSILRRSSRATSSLFQFRIRPETVAEDRLYQPPILTHYRRPDIGKP